MTHGAIPPLSQALIVCILCLDQPSLESINFIDLFKEPALTSFFPVWFIPLFSTLVFFIAFYFKFNSLVLFGFLSFLE